MSKARSIVCFLAIEKLSIGGREVARGLVVMGISLRVFLVNDDDSIDRFALTRYERLLSRDPNERIT